MAGSVIRSLRYTMCRVALPLFAVVFIVSGAFMIDVGLRRIQHIKETTERVRVRPTSDVRHEGDQCVYTFEWKNSSRTCVYEDSSRCYVVNNKGTCIAWKYFCRRPTYIARFSEDSVRCEYDVGKSSWAVLYGFGIAFVVVGGLAGVAFVVLEARHFIHS
jgi:hypothetical protein